MTQADRKEKNKKIKNDRERKKKEKEKKLITMTSIDHAVYRIEPLVKVL